MWNKFNIEHSTLSVGEKNIIRVKIDGYLDSSTFPKLQEHLNNLTEEDNINFLLDLADLDYISSAGLGVLMGILREVRARGGDLKITNMSEKIERVFNLLGFSRLMKIYPSDVEAINSFNQASQKESAPNGEEY